jgi:hypothetical protein
VVKKKKEKQEYRVEGLANLWVECMGIMCETLDSIPKRKRKKKKKGNSKRLS